jgi:transaldolase
MAFEVNDLNRKELLLMELAQDVKSIPARVPPPASDVVLDKLNSLGTRLWLDTGNLDEASKLWRKEMSALTTNNTLANQVVQTGVMDSVIANTAARVRDIDPSVSDDELILDVVFVVNCQIAQRLVGAFGALVSVELHPAVANDIDKTVRYAQRYYAVNPEHFIVKIPLTPEGYCGVARARELGIPINFTLGFSARQNYLAAQISKPNYVNVFLGRLNAVVADNQLGDGKYVGEKVTLASQAGVKSLRERNPSIPTHQIAASMRNADQMVSLAGVDVYTIPPKAVAEFYAQGHRPDDITLKTGENYNVALNPTTDSAAIELLWTVDDRFMRFAHDLDSMGGDKIDGNDLRTADKDFKIGLFGDFTDSEKVEIRTKGKIPETARWKTRASLDDLMTESAIQSFTVDQAAFDDHIRKMIGK